MSLFRKKVNVGLDFGSHSLQWAATDNRGKDCEVWRAPIHPGRSSKDDHLFGDPLKIRLKALLSQAEKENKLWSRTVVVGVQGQSVVSGYLELPQLKDDELEMAVLSNISREVPFPVDSLEVVHLPVVSLTAGRKAVFYSVWKRAAGQRLRQLCEYCDLKVKRIEATGIALTRELFQNHALDPKRFYAIVNVGFELSQIILVRAGYPYYLRDIPVGGRDITYAVQIGSQVTWEEAEEIKCSYPLYELVHTAGPLLSELSYELSRSMAYFRRRFVTDEIEAVYLSGGSSLLKDFPDWLEEELKLPVRRENWQQIRSRSAGSDSSLNKVSTGLALGQ
jgi:type IV pilus assembly protein PilM